MARSLLDHPLATKATSTRFVLISDTHGQTFDVPDGDVLVHAGDLTRSGIDLQALRTTIAWLADLPHHHKVIIAGNHDLILDDAAFKAGQLTPGMAKKRKEMALQIIREARSAGVVYLDPFTEFISFDNGNIAFQRSRSELREAWHRIPWSTDIVVTHAPPDGILDTIEAQSSSGCPHLRERVEKVKPVLHVFGHVHEQRGVLHDITRRIIYVNASSSDQWMGRVGIGELQPIVIDMPNVWAGRNATLGNRIFDFVTSWLPNMIRISACRLCSTVASDIADQPERAELNQSEMGN